LRSRLRSRRCRIGSSIGHADLQGTVPEAGGVTSDLATESGAGGAGRRCLHGGGRLKQRTQPRMFANPSASSWKRQVVGRTNSLARSNPSFAAGSYLCTYMEGPRCVAGGGRAGGVPWVWPEPILARAGAAREVWLGLLRRLIPRPGQDRLPGALGARRKLSPIVWAFAVRTLLAFRLLRLRAGRGSCGARSCARR
jgi:hypothetical protein